MDTEKRKRNYNRRNINYTPSDFKRIKEIADLIDFNEYIHIIAQKTGFRETDIKEILNTGEQIIIEKGILKDVEKPLIINILPSVQICLIYLKDRILRTTNGKIATKDQEKRKIAKGINYKELQLSGSRFACQHHVNIVTNIDTSLKHNISRGYCELKVVKEDTFLIREVQLLNWLDKKVITSENRKFYFDEFYAYKEKYKNKELNGEAYGRDI